MKSPRLTYAWLSSVCLATVLLVSGCVSFHAPFSGGPAEPAPDGHGYALLYDLMGDEANVSKLLIIHREHAALHDLIVQISERCGAAHKQLAAFGKADMWLNLKDQGLPAAEVQARESIGKAKAKRLLVTRSSEFEPSLLLTQSEALTYGSHLAAVTAKLERDPERAKLLRQLSDDLAQLEDRVIALLRSHYSWPADK